MRFARDFAARRNPTRTQKMSRLYAVEPTPTLTGSAADHRFIAGPRELHQHRHGAGRGNPAAVDPARPRRRTGSARLIADLHRNPGRALVHAGPDQPAETHALVHAINEELGARGSHARPDRAGRLHSPTDQAASLRELDRGHAGRAR